jgi:hypothetical protein
MKDESLKFPFYYPNHFPSQSRHGKRTKLEDRKGKRGKFFTCTSHLHFRSLSCCNLVRQPVQRCGETYEVSLF